MRLNFSQMMRPACDTEGSGAAILVRQTPSRSLFGVIDALGHGETSRQAARMALGYLELVDLDLGLEALMRGVHHGLRGTRGATATLCMFSAGTLYVAELGAIALHRLGRPLRRGISGGARLGDEGLREMRLHVEALEVGERLVLHCGGIASATDLESLAGLSGPQACHQLIQRGAPHGEDASILVVDVEAAAAHSSRDHSAGSTTEPAEAS